MSKITNNLDNRLSEQFELITALCDSFDAGNEVVALSIAMAVRVLIHDTSNSISLFKHLEIKDSTRFLSTNCKDQHQPVHLGLVRRINVGVNDGQGGEAKYWALCDERYFPSPNVSNFLPFSTWWAEEIFDNSEFQLSRKDTILAVSNKDGGAHYDKEVEEKYDTFRKSWSGETTLIGNRSGISRGFDNVPIRPAVRQIAHEILNCKFEESV